MFDKKLSEKFPENYALLQAKKNKMIYVFFSLIMVSLFSLLGLLFGIYLKLSTLVEIMAK